MQTVTYEQGLLITTDESGNRTSHRPVPNLANLVVVLIRTLIDRQVLDEQFLEDCEFDLDDIIKSVESLGGKYHNPVIHGSAQESVDDLGAN